MPTTDTSPLILATPLPLESLRDRIAERPGTVYAVLDACDEPRVPEKVEELGDQSISLYRGQAEQDFSAIAPYLAIVDEPLLSWLIAELWDNPWGIFAITDASFPDVRKHFRRFLMVLDPDGNEMYFRFYDPRLLPTFLETCTQEELDEFFGPIDDFVMLDDDGELQTYSRKARS
ncbi:MAG: DUF4123 domain-containing protein [Planctomycetota bacterium]|nr:DUF4123 domain-containing protein [Planctomycetota bacterium]